VLFGSSHKSRLPAADEALPGRATTPYPVPATHAVLGTPLKGPWPEGTQHIYVAMGCFWGAERIFWQTPGVVTTAVGYQGGTTPNPTYDETCTGSTGHTEAVLVAYDPSVLSTPALLKIFWEGHEQRAALEASRPTYAEALKHRGYGDITTELRSAADAGEFFYAEEYHQQYLYKVPNGYCGIGGTGVSCPVGVVG